MADLVLERDTEALEEQKRLRHERYRALVGTNSYEEHAKRAFGEQASRGGTQTLVRDKDYVANRVRNASDVAKGLYTMPRTQLPQDYTQPAPDWTYAQQLAPMQEPEYVENAEETEDERPTPTTTQYMTLDKARTWSAAEAADDEFTLSNSLRVVIGVLATVVVAIIALIVVNAYAISSLSKDTAKLEGELATYTQSLTAVEQEIAEAQSEEAIRQFAEQEGMILG
ncbi:MAG: hypothetical protein J6D37_04400 [Clostridia bacterium]|nr:hypothetical protein [Clostridia bacterium]